MWRRQLRQCALVGDQRMIKAVLDTNILISGFIIKQGACAKIIDTLREKYFLLITSDGLLLEFSRAVHYPRIWDKYKLSKQEVKDYFQALEEGGEVVCPKKVPKVIPEDPSDDIVLATAVEGKADYLVSGDQHLLKLKKYKGIRILSPAKFVKILGKEC